MDMREKEQNIKNTNRSEAEKIDLIRLIRALWKKAWLIIFVGIIGGVASYGWTDYTTTPMYQSSAMFYVNSALSVGSDASSITSRISLGTAKELISSYIVILNTRETLNDVIDYAGLDCSQGQLKGMISAAPVSETEIFQITVTSSDPEEAELIANAIGEILPKRISTIIEGTSVKIVDHAVLPSTSMGTGHVSNTIKGIFIGMVLCAGLVLLLELLDTTIRSAEDVEQVCQYPILTMIPDMGVTTGSGYYYDMKGKKKKKKKKKNVFAQDKGKILFGDDINFEAAEGYKLLRTKIEFSFADENDSHVIGVSSALAGEGKSITAINLAYALAQLEKKVLLIDCDLRRPSVAARLELNREPGLSNFLIRKANISEVIQPYKISDKVNLSVIAAGKTPPNPVELLSSAKMEKTMEAFRSHYDYIVLDLPPIDEVGDAMAVSKLADGMLMVVRQDYCDRQVLKSAISEFEFADTRILGIALNYSHDNGYTRKYGRYKKYYRKYRYRYMTPIEEEEQ